MISRLFILFTLISFSFLHAREIQNYTIDIYVNQSGELNITETIEVAAKEKNLSQFEMATKGYHSPTVFKLKINSMINSEKSIRSVDSEPYGFSVFLNGMPVKMSMGIGHENDSQKSVLIRVYDEYMKELLTDEELKSIDDEAKLIYTIQYQVKKSVVATKEHPDLDTIQWSPNKISSRSPIRNLETNLHLPSSLNKEAFEVFDFTYTAKNNDKQTYEWIDTRHFHANIDNIKYNDLLLSFSFPRGKLEQTAETNFDLVLDKHAKIKNSDAFKFDQFLLYWQFPFILLYFIFLYYYARSYGSSGAMGSIVVRYNAPEGMSLLQSGLIADKEADISDFPAAVMELVSLGHVKIVPSETNQKAHLKRIQKDINTLTNDQVYLLKNILFHDADTYQISQNDYSLSHKFETLNKKLYTWLHNRGFMHENLKQTRRRFLTRAYLSSLPILLFSLYVTNDIYGEQMVIAGIVGMYFITVAIYVTMLKGFSHTWWFLLSVYFILSVPYYLEENNTFVGMISSPIAILPIIYAVIWSFYQKIGIYSGKGMQAHRHLLGYKAFVKRTEVPKLESLIKAHPEHVEKSIAYAMLFKFIKHPIGSLFKKTVNAGAILNNHNQKEKVSTEEIITYLKLWAMGPLLVIALKFYEALG